MPRRARSSSRNNSTANIGLEQELWLAAPSLPPSSFCLQPLQCDEPRWQWSVLESRDMDGKPGRMRERARTNQFGLPPGGNVNFAWVPQFIYHLALFSSGITGHRSARSHEELG